MEWAMTTANSLCALVGHDLKETAPQEDGAAYWYTPPTKCQLCGQEFAGHRGIAPINRPRDTAMNPWVVHA